MSETVVLLDEMGNEVEFQVLATFGIDDIDYAALIPLEDTEGLTYLLRIEYDDFGEMVLLGIEDEEELEEVIEAFEEVQKDQLQ